MANPTFRIAARAALAGVAALVVAGAGPAAARGGSYGHQGHQTQHGRTVGGPQENDVTGHFVKSTANLNAANVAARGAPVRSQLNIGVLTGKSSTVNGNFLNLSK